MVTGTGKRCVVKREWRVLGRDGRRGSFVGEMRIGSVDGYSKLGIINKCRGARVALSGP